MPPSPFDPPPMIAQPGRLLSIAMALAANRPDRARSKPAGLTSRDRAQPFRRCNGRVDGQDAGATRPRRAICIAPMTGPQASGSGGNSDQAGGQARPPGRQQPAKASWSRSSPRMPCPSRRHTTALFHSTHRRSCRSRTGTGPPTAESPYLPLDPPPSCNVSGRIAVRCKLDYLRRRSPNGRRLGFRPPTRPVPRCQGIRRFEARAGRAARRDTRALAPALPRQGAPWSAQAAGTQAMAAAVPAAASWREIARSCRISGRRALCPWPGAPGGRGPGLPCGSADSAGSPRAVRRWR